jgi:hypothetical protein
MDNSESSSTNRQKHLIKLRQLKAFRLDSFEKATSEVIRKYQKEIKINQVHISKIEKHLPNVEEEYSRLSSEEWDVITQYSEFVINRTSKEEFILSLAEMKIVYLFKSLEVLMKKIVLIAFPKTNIKDFSNWDSLKTFYKSNDIDITSIPGYKESFELKAVNNSIKHNGLINDEVKKIMEFNSATDFTYDNLNKFYKRIKPHVHGFITVLMDSVENCLYEFSHNRLSEMASEFYERMDDQTYSAFISKLKEKLRPDYISPNNISDVAEDLPF